MTDFLNLRAVLDFIYNIVQSHGWSIIIFVVLIRAVLLPLDIKSRKGMRQMTLMQPEIDKLTKKYGNDKEKLQRKQAELFKKNHYNPMAGCWPILIQYPVLICMFGAMRAIANEQLILQMFNYIAGQEPIEESWLWVRSLWMPDSPFTSFAPSLTLLQQANDINVWQKMVASMNPETLELVKTNLAAYTEDVEALLAFSDKNTLQTSIQTLYNAMAAQPLYIEHNAVAISGINILLIDLTVYKHYNGLLLLPALAGVTQWLMTIMTPQNGNAQQQNGQGAGMNNFMKYFFPLLTVYFCLVSNAGFAIYWVVGNIIAGIESIAITKYYDHQDKLAKTATEGENV